MAGRERDILKTAAVSAGESTEAKYQTGPRIAVTGLISVSVLLLRFYFNDLSWLEILLKRLQ